MAIFDKCSIIIFISVCLAFQADALNLLEFETINKTFYAQALETVNHIRVLHQVDKLSVMVENTVDDDFNYLAKDFNAEVIKLVHAVVNQLDTYGLTNGIEKTFKDKEFALDDHPTYGHGIAVLKAEDYAKLKSLEGGIAARFWYNTEYPYHDFVTNVYHKQTAHFSQMVWKETKYFAIAAKFTVSNDLAIVYLYHPYGNYEDDVTVTGARFKENVKDSTQTYEEYLNDEKLHKYPNNKDRAWYSYEDYF